MSLRNRGFAALIATLVLLSAVAPVAMAAQVNHEAGAAPQGHISTDVTVAVHDRANMSALEYENNNGEIEELPATLNDSDDVDDLGTGHVNPYAMTATDIEFEDAGEFPRKSEDDNAASALDASEWTTDTSGTAGSAAVSDVTTAPSVEAVELSTSSQTSGDVATFTYSNFSITSDVEKRYLQMAADVDTLDSGAHVEMWAVDSDGDYVAITAANASANEDSATVLANGTGEGDVLQEQVGQLSVQGSGDGTMGEITKLTVRVEDADATLQFAMLNGEKTGEYTFGEKYVDTDDEDDLETETLTEPHGEFYINDMGSMGQAFDQATIHGLTMPVEFRLADLPDEDVNASYTQASSYPAFQWMFESYYRIQLPSAYDLSYANAVLEDTVSVPSGRYETVEYAEGVGDTDFSDIDSWTSVSDQYSSEGNDVELDNTIQPGQEIAIHYQYPVTDDEKASLEATGMVGGPMGAGSGGPADWPVIGGVIAGLGSLWAWVTGRLPFGG
jgi:hypothetical protein